MADDKKAIGSDVGTSAEATEQPRPAPNLSDTAAHAPLGPEALTVEEQLILEHEGQAALFEMGESIPDAPESPHVAIPEQSELDKEDEYCCLMTGQGNERGAPETFYQGGKQHEA